MKVIISAAAESIDAEIDPRFGRGAYLILVDTETLDWQSFETLVLMSAVEQELRLPGW